MFFLYIFIHCIFIWILFVLFLYIFFIGCSIIWFRMFFSYVFVRVLIMYCKLFMSCSYHVHGSSVHVLFMIYFCSCPAYMFLLISCSYPAHILLIWIHIINYIYTLLVWILLMSCSCGLCLCSACMNSVHAQLMSSACEFCLCVSANANFLHVLLMWVPFISCSCRLCSCPIRMTSAHVLLMWALFKYIKTYFLIHYLNILWFETSYKMNEWSVMMAFLTCKSTFTTLGPSFNVWARLEGPCDSRVANRSFFQRCFAWNRKRFARSSRSKSSEVSTSNHEPRSKWSCHCNDDFGN